MIKELSIKFEGFKKPSDEQPPILDKEGKPYDLNDPQWPVIKGHKFSNKYWAMPRTENVEIRYLEERWKYFNQTRFHNDLKPCTIVLLKDMNAWKMRLRGQWQQMARKLRISPNLFNAPHEGWVNRVLIHEMCHQFVSEKYGKTEKENKGHGPLWRMAMQMVDLTPLQFDTESNETYTDQFEKKIRNKQIEKQEEFWKEFPDEYTKWHMPVPGDPAVFEDNEGKRHFGLISDVKIVKGDLQFAVITDVVKGKWLRWKIHRKWVRRPPENLAPDKNDPVWAEAIKNAKPL